MTENIADALIQLRRDIASDTERIVREQQAPFREEVLGHLDAIYKELDTLKTEYHAPASRNV